jgi:methyl-accepting chemotaxis protein
MPKIDISTASTTEPNGGVHAPEFLKASLANVQANILIADPQFTIIYANDRAVETLRGIAADIRRAFNVEVDDIVGASIHRFHKDARRVERILRDPAALPHQAEFTFGNITLQAKINGVYGPGREVL